MLGGGNTGGGGIQNDNTQTPANNFEDSPQASNDMDDEIPF
jgi:single-strand DNA-binding protein